ncbi:MAG: DUF1015 domain-containing protein [Archangiaceae bacterium]|nr:DUF1015 domain-containing protein [Archangiaceae bacterium]
MALLKPFRGARPNKTKAQRVAAPPYDVVSSAEARAYAKGNPDCFFRVSRPEVDLAADVDEHAEAVYQKGKENLAAMLGDGTLTVDREPRFYVYRQRMGDHQQVGLVAAASVDEYDRGQIKKHELTRADKEDDRTRHIDVLGANDEPVFLTYRARPDIDAAIAQVTSSAPEHDFTTDDGIGHTFWVADPKASPSIASAFAQVKVLYIADGHHRSAAASRVAKLRAGQPGEHGAFLAVVFPHDQLKILPYNRLVRDLNGRSVADLLEKLADPFDVQRNGQAHPEKLHQLCMYLADRWVTLEAKAGSYPETPTGQLDVSILQANVLQPLLGIGDPRKDPRIDFVGGIRGTKELEKRVDSGQARVAFSMFPTRVEQMMAIADANEIMPPKSTWFEPKLRSGLVVHLFDPR